jgi:formate dehydrogenase iron-sulfur subunit
MSHEEYYIPKGRLITPGEGVLLALMVTGFIAAIYRFSLGLGATTNLSDQYPWGIWVAFDVICGVALAAGGFTTAAVVYIFWAEKYHGLARPAVLTGFIGYVFVAIGLMADLGIPWHIWHPIIMWPKHSALFEVAWCVMLYSSVLALEFAPSVFERLHWFKLQRLWQLLAPYYVVVALSWFAFIMSHSVVWAIAVFVVTGTLAVLLPRQVGGGPGGMPVLLIIAGVLFSTAHQSSLGTLFLLTPDKLHPLWWTPLLPVMFYLSAIAVGFAMVIFEATLSSRAFRLPEEREALSGMSRLLFWALLVYLVLKLADIAARGVLPQLFSWYGLLLLAELAVGVIAPLALLSRRWVRQDMWWRFVGSCLVIFGLIFNRFNITLFAMHRPGPHRYFPSLEELLVTTALVSAIIFFYKMAVKLFPVLPAPEHETPAGAGVSAAAQPLTGGGE